MRNLKILSLALMAALAMSAMVASAAQGSVEPKLTSATTYPLTLHGEQLATGNSFTAPLGTGTGIVCSKGTFDGLATLNGPALAAEFTPTYEGCKSENGLFVTVTHNGCKFKFYDLTTSSAHYKATTDLICPPEKQIEVHVYLFSGHTFPVCTLDMAEQKGLPGATVTNQAGGHVLLEGTITGIKYTVTNGSTESCKNGTYTDGVYHANVTLKGKDHLGNPVPIHVK